MGASNTVIGLDIGRHSVKAAWVESRLGGVSVTRTELLHVPLGDSNPMRVVGPWLEQLGIARHTCALAIHGGDCVVQAFSPQEDDPRPVADIVAMEVAKFNDIASTDMRYGSRFFKVDQGRRILLVMVKPEHLDRVLEFGRMRHLRVGELLPTSSAISMLVSRYSATQSGTTVVIDIGHGGSSVAFCGAQGMLFSRSFRMGGEAFTEALREGYGLSISQADTFKVTKGRLDADDPQVRERLVKVADLLCSEVASCVSSFRSYFPTDGVQPERIVVCGGGTLLVGLGARLADALGLPLVPLSVASNGVLEDRQAGHAVAVGLAQSVVCGGDGVVSLLPEYMRDELVFRRKKPVWIAAGIVLALALGVFTLSVVRAIRQDRRELEAVRRAIKERQDLVARINRLEGQIAVYDARTKPLRECLGWGVAMRELITLVAESLEPEDWVSLICDADSYESVPLFDETPETQTRTVSRIGGMRDKRLLRVPPSRTEAPPKDMPQELPRRFVVEGYTRALDLASVKALVQRLKVRSDLVAAADLRFDDTVQPADWFRRYTAGAEYKRFSLEVTLRSGE
jgi:Tfp pilus assembly PilM family ATPase